MSWLQTFLQKFKKDEENLEETFPIEHTHHSAQPVKYDNKEMQSRISYQYPKGKFRFPIIPDEHAARHERISAPQSKPIPQSKPAPRSKQPVAKGGKVRQEQGLAPKELVAKFRSSSPFRPTEIPSPIYGFQRPKNDSNKIEHELSHFSAAFAKEEEIQPVQVQSTEETPDQVESAMELPVQVEKKGEFPVQLESIAETFETSVQDECPLTGGSECYADEEIAIGLEVIEMAEEVNPSSVLGDEQRSTVDENATTKSVETEAEIMVSREETTEEPERPRRRHLPFNVMMLKSDKQKMQQRNKSSFSSSHSSVHDVKKEVVTPTPVSEVNQGNADSTVPIQKEAYALVEQHPLVPDEKEVPFEQQSQTHEDFEFPRFSLLQAPIAEPMDQEWVEVQAELLNQTLQNFNVGAKVVNVTQGPAVTRFEVQPEPGVKVNKITNLTDDIKLSLAARDIRIEAPIPGKHTIGIEVPNKKSRPVLISEIIESETFVQSSSPLTAVLGLDISGQPIVTDLKKMPHGLIAGATGSGKSVCINSILISLLYKASPEDLKLLLIDPKMVELAPYNHIPHLVSPVITDVKAATAALKWAVEEMERRYELFAHTGVRDINRFNELAMQHKRYSDKLPFIVIIIDELADLMMMSPADVEEAICRIAQKARACGIHLIIATQRPSVDVITGLIKANVPTRIAFSVSSQVDSRTIIDIGGAEKLLGRGDMLFLENGSSKPVRLQGTFVSDEEIDSVVAHIREQREPDYLFEQEELLKKAQVSEEEDELFYEACEYVVDQKGASTSSLQRRFKIGYNRAARLMDLMEQHGFISGANGSKPREVFISSSDLESIQDSN